MRGSMPAGKRSVKLIPLLFAAPVRKPVVGSHSSPVRFMRAALGIVGLALLSSSYARPSVRRYAYGATVDDINDQRQEMKSATGMSQLGRATVRTANLSYSKPRESAIPALILNCSRQPNKLLLPGARPRSISQQRPHKRSAELRCRAAGSELPACALLFGLVRFSYQSVQLRLF